MQFYADVEGPSRARAPKVEKSVREHLQRCTASLNGKFGFNTGALGIGCETPLLP